MSKKLYFLISFVLVLSWASVGYGFTTHPDAFIKIDFNHNAQPNDVNTQPTWTGFVLPDSGSEVNDVDGNPSGVIIDIGGSAASARRPDPNSNSSLGVGIAKEEMYRDFFYGLSDNPLDITLWGLGADRKVKIYIYAYDDSSENLRIANWTANGAELLTTEFEGGISSEWPIDPNDPDAWLFDDAKYYDFNGIAYADDVGRIQLASAEDANNDGVPFAFANGLVIVTYGDANTVYKAHRPVPFDGTEDISINPTLSWIPGAGATGHAVYLGTDPCALEYQGVETSASFTPSDFLTLDETHYWRIDELPGPVTGDIWSLTTTNNHLMEDFETYTDDGGANKLRDTWTDRYASENSSISQVTMGLDPAIDEKSMEYWFRNNYSPYYSESWVHLADIGIDSNFAGMDVQSISVQFFGQAANPITEQMYAILSDGTNIATVDYTGEMNDITVEEWQEWNISIPALLADNPSLDLTDVDLFGIGFAEGAHVEGTVYFDDIRLYTTRCVLVKRSDKLARADYAPINNEDCVVDNIEVEIIARDWLTEDQVVATKNPTDANLVIYYPLNEGDGNSTHPEPNDPCWIGTFWNSEIDPPSDINTTWAKDSAPGIGDGNCVYMTGNYGGGIRCGTLGEAGLGIGPTPPDSNKMTLSLWVKWLGPRYWDPGLLIKGQGLMGKRGDYSDDDMIWTFWISANPGQEGGIGLGNHSSTGDDLVSAAGVMDPFVGEWAHIAATYNGSTDPNNDQAAKIYLGGFEVASGPFAFSHGDDPNLKLTIGQTTNAHVWAEGPASFWGYIDEVRIYNRALEPNEVAYLADPTPGDGFLQIPVTSPAELYEQELEGDRVVNFRDFAVMADMWLKKEYWP